MFPSNQDALAQTIAIQSVYMAYEQFFLDYHAFLDLLVNDSLVSAIEPTNAALIFYPSGDSHKLRLAFERKFDIMFSREALPSGGYDWVSVVGDIRIQLAVAEIFDHSGTIVTNPIQHHATSN